MKFNPFSRLAEHRLAKQWARLDPMFIRGCWRSGTTLVGRVMNAMALQGFAEGHIWYDVVRPFEQIRDPAYKESLRSKYFTMGPEDRITSLEHHIAVSIDQFHRKHLSLCKRWYDKSPGPDGETALPILSELFPRSQILFVYRNGIAVVNSAVTKWPKYENGVEIFSRHWANSMSIWRGMRESLEGRYLEISQELIVAEPESMARQMTQFLNLSRYEKTVEKLLSSDRHETSFPDKNTREYGGAVDWDDVQKRTFQDICGAEMEAWGYEMDFEETGGMPKQASTLV